MSNNSQPAPEWEVGIRAWGPDDEPGVWEFEFVTEHRETVVVEAPNEDYASETADSERDYRGKYVQTTHTESRRLKTITEVTDE